MSFYEIISVSTPIILAVIGWFARTAFGRVDDRIRGVEADVSEIKADTKRTAGEVNEFGRVLARVEGRMDERHRA